MGFFSKKINKEISDLSSGVFDLLLSGHEGEIDSVVQIGNLGDFPSDFTTPFGKLKESCFQKFNSNLEI